MDEREAIARLKRGDISGLEALVHLYQTQALRAAYLVCQERALSEDLVQAAFLRAYERISHFDGSRPFGPWFLRLVTNDALMATTRRRTLSLEGEALEAAGSNETSYEDAYEIVEDAETKQAIWAALERVSPGQRAAIVMRYYLDMSDAEVSQALDSPPGTVRRRLHDARQNLGRILPAWVRQTSEE